MRKKLLTALVTGMFLIGAASISYATDFDFSGNFTFDNDVQVFSFGVAGPSNITVFSSSWDDGGFDPMLGLWDSSGALINFQDDGFNVGSTLSNGVLYNHGTWDSYYTASVAAGNYLLSITQFSNFNNGSNLSDGFNYDGNPNFTFDLGYGTQPYFNGVLGGEGFDPRTSDWAFHILNVETASQVDPVPEPATMFLLGTGLVGVAGAARRKKKNQA